MRQLAVMGVALALFAGPAAADPFSAEKVQALESVRKCRGLSDDAERLRCYDGALARVEEALAPPTIEEQTAVFGQREQPLAPGAPAATAAAEEEGFSLFGLTLFGGETSAPGDVAVEAGGRITGITARITDYGFTPDGKIIVFLDNGHVWRQIDSGKARVPSDPEERVVRINEASLGSFLMSIGEANRGYRVRRVK